MFKKIDFEMNEKNIVANDESEEDNGVTNSVTLQVSTQNVVPSKQQRGYSRN
jgi:hypothetical protein